jgi:triosephosphate isomerase
MLLNGRLWLSRISLPQTISFSFMDTTRKKLVAGNWKMNTSITEGEALVDQIIEGLPVSTKCSVIIAPPFTHLAMLKQKAVGHPIHLGAQNCHTEKSGAFTGEVSADMLKSVGVEYVIVGHSERRQFFHETNDIVRTKVNVVLEAGLIPIFCCGETLDIRQTDTQNIFVRQQLEEGIFHLEKDQVELVCIAYEPIWAIGTGVTATPEQAQEMQNYIRDQLAIRYDKITSEVIHILYGGSIKPDNAEMLFAQEDVDGGLIGGASLSAASFLEIVNKAC